MIGTAIEPTPFGEIVAAFPFEGKIMIFTKYYVYVHDPKDPESEYKRLNVDVKRPPET